MNLKVAVIVPTYNAGHRFSPFLDALCGQTGQFDTVIVDSGSDDATLSLAGKYHLNVVEISNEDFNHGGTRQLAVDSLSGVDIVVFLTQDAILADPGSLDYILKPFENNDVAAACGRQIPRKAAGAIESHARLFNYSDKSFIRSINDVSEFGLKTAFISNSFAAYRVSALNAVRNFPDNVIFGEDMYVATKMLTAGYKIAYVAEACVYHSHDYSLRQEMKRYFDMGVFHAREPWIRQELGGAESEGVKFVFSEVQYLFSHAFWRIPEGILRTLFRYTGFRLGLMENSLPVRLKVAMAMNKTYFKR